jgi:hypothetical protein
MKDIINKYISRNFKYSNLCEYWVNYKFEDGRVKVGVKEDGNGCGNGYVYGLGDGYGYGYGSSNGNGFGNGFGSGVW